MDDNALEMELSESNSMKQYLSEIGKYPLLTPEKEMEYGKEVALGREAAEMLAEGCRESSLEDLVEAGKIARQALVNSNLRLVVNMARKYQGHNLELTDLIQEGSIGLMRAAEKYDYTLGYRFSTYATWWIRQSLTRAIADQSRVIRLPVHMQEAKAKINRLSSLFHQEHHRLPTAEELSQLTGIELKKVYEVLNLDGDAISFDQSVGDEEDAELLDFIPDPSPTTEEQAEAPLTSRYLMDILQGTLTEREYLVILRRYGFEDGKIHTLEEIGHELGITRERVRQIEDKAIRKLQYSRNREALRDLMAS